MHEIVPVRLETDLTLPGPMVSVPSPLARRLRLADAMQVRLRFGRASAPALLQLKPDGPASGNTVSVSREVARLLHLPAPLTLLLKARPPDGSLRKLPVLDLGPLVGVLAREPASHVRLYLEGARLAGAEAFWMRIGSVRWRRGVVHGYRLASEGWQRWTYPFPHVVYDRAPGRWEADGKARLFAGLARRGTVTFNGAVGYKWKIHRRLWTEPGLRPHLPRTVVTRRPATVLRLLARWGGLFVKPSRGQRGEGIWRLRKAEGDRCQVTFSGREESYTVGPRQLLRLLRSLFRREAHLVQREIPLARLEGAVWDVRALAVRDTAGRWQLAGVAARLGRRGRIVSNLHRGGRPTALAPVLEALFGERAPDLQREIETVALRAARTVQRFVPAAGELGIDLGVDEEGRIWIIEVNPKPGRQSFLFLSPPEERLRLYALPFLYARFLAGYGEESRIEGARQPGVS